MCAAVSISWAFLRRSSRSGPGFSWDAFFQDAPSVLCGLATGDADAARYCHLCESAGVLRTRQTIVTMRQLACDRRSAGATVPHPTKASGLRHNVQRFPQVTAATADQRPAPKLAKHSKAWLFEWAVQGHSLSGSIAFCVKHPNVRKAKATRGQILNRCFAGRSGFLFCCLIEENFAVSVISLSGDGALCAAHCSRSS